ncbi:site-specific integrase [Desulfobacterota bacterium AH_259_B03_O07]|nr:site-specific integrase [Desulfobacterota bacterium AH_259_B03_O07]
MGSVFQRGNSWVIEYRVKGKTKRESVGKKGVVTKTMAREILKKREQQVKLGQYDMLKAKIPTFSEFGDEYIKHVRDTVKKRSWQRDKYPLKYFGDLFGDETLSKISISDIDVYKTIRLKKVEPATVNRELQCIRHLFNIAKRNKKFFGENPVSASGLIKVDNQVERILSAKEEQLLLKVSPAYLRDIILIALNTGMRRGEILNLQWSWIDLGNNIITLPQTHTKSRKARKIPINSKLRKIILELKLKTGGSEFVFPSDQSRTGHLEWVKRSFITACKKAGINGLRFHDLRHTAATRMVESGANIVAIKEILGHTDLKTTMRYAHPDASLKDAVELIASDFCDSFTDKSTDIDK